MVASRLPMLEHVQEGKYFMVPYAPLLVLLCCVLYTYQVLVRCLSCRTAATSASVQAEKCELTKHTKTGILLRVG